MEGVAAIRVLKIYVHFFFQKQLYDIELVTSGGDEQAVSLEVISDVAVGIRFHNHVVDQHVVICVLAVDGVEQGVVATLISFHFNIDKH